MLICPNKKPVPVSEYASCHLAVVPAHAVVTRPEAYNKVVAVLQRQRVSDDDAGGKVEVRKLFLCVDFVGQFLDYY